MTVGIDIVIDPSGAVSGGRVATASLDRVENAAEGVTRATMTLREEMNAYAATSRATSQAQQQYLQGLAASRKAANDFTAATRLSGEEMKQFRGFVGQAGFQISDIAIQLEAGANAATVFGIQGGQLLGALNPIAGAMLTIAGIAIGSFSGGMWGAAEATRELEEITKRTNKEINALSEAQARAASVTLIDSLNEESQALRKLNAQIAVRSEELENKTKRLESIGTSNIFGKGILLAAEEMVTTLPEAQRELDGLIDQRTILTEKINSGTEVLRKYQGVLAGNKLDERDLDQLQKERTSTIEGLNRNLEVLQQRAAGNNREAFIQETLFRSGAEAGSEYAEQVRTLAGQTFDLEQKIRAANSAVKDFDKDGEYISRLEQQIGLVGLSARQQAILRAEYSLSADATDEQIAKARELAAALYDAKEAQRPADTSDADFESSVTGASRAIAAENMTLLEELENQRQMVLLYQETGIGDANAHAKALVAIQRKTYIEQANVAASGFGSLLRLQEAYGDDSSGIYKTLLVAQKTATLYSVLLSSYDAIGKAWASAPFPYNLPAVATATVETGALAGLVEAVTPAFATGGYVHGAGTGTSDSIPARLSMGEFVMPARETSRYAPELNAMRSGTYNGGNGAARVTVINQTTGRVDSAEAEWVSRDELIVTLREEVPGIVASEINDAYSRTNRAMQQSYVMQRNL
ncbi:coil containing protein [Vibrio phage 13VV501A]|nr:coil containing protein [Vibrio phage 13VV501A]